MELTGGAFTLQARASLVCDADFGHPRSEARALAETLFAATGARFGTGSGRGKASPAVRVRRVSRREIPNSEGYHLDIGERGVQIRASATDGLRRATQTLVQLLPARPPAAAGWDGASWTLPALHIEDAPRFAWRGMHLDTGRHFMPAAFLRRFIDLLALHKFNVFHWHLTEDQGWRLEIPDFPKLTTIGAWRAETVIGRPRDDAGYDARPHGGFYTAADVREIVRYAAARGITVMPEIEMPGHSQAALAAYPELSCTGGPHEVARTWGVFKDVFCAGNENVFDFLETVMEAVLDLFPSRFIHVGGDECPKDRWRACPKCQARIRAERLKDEHELQSWFIRRMERFLRRRGRRLVGWDEILEGGLAPGATVMSWRGEDGGIAAARQGHDVVMAPNHSVYFDYYQAEPEREPLAIGRFLPLEKVYAYEPVPAALTADEARHVLGAQGQLWTEYMPYPRQVEYMAFPRMCALAEVLWSPAAARDYGDFRRRLDGHLPRLDRLGVNYRRPEPPAAEAAP